MKTFWIILFLIAIFFSPLGHDLDRYGIPARLAWNDSSWILGLCLLAWLATFFVRNFYRKIPSRPHFIFLIGYFLVLIVGVLLSPVPRSLADVFPLALPGLLALFFSFLASKRQAVLFALAVLGVLVLQAQWAVLQFTLQHDLGLSILGEPRLSPAIAGVAKFTFEDTKIIRGYGPYLHANALAGAMLAGLVLLSYMALVMTREKFIQFEVRVFFLSVYVCLLLALLISFSRLAYLGFAALVVCSLALVFSRRLMALRSLRPYGITLLVCAILFSGLLAGRLADPADQASTERLRGYEWYGRLFTPQIFWRGMGVGNYERHLYSFLMVERLSFHPWEIAPIHSALLLALVEVGLLPLFGLFLFWGWFVWKRWQPSVQTVAFMVLPTVPIILLDHYLVSLPSTLAVLLTVWFLILAMEPKPG